jgi:hypothetical protein
MTICTFTQGTCPSVILAKSSGLEDTQDQSGLSCSRAIIILVICVGGMAGIEPTPSKSYDWTRLSQKSHASSLPAMHRDCHSRPCHSSVLELPDGVGGFVRCYLNLRVHWQAIVVPAEGLGNPGLASCTLGSLSAGCSSDHPCSSVFPLETFQRLLGGRWYFGSILCCNLQSLWLLVSPGEREK